MKLMRWMIDLSFRCSPERRYLGLLPCFEKKGRIKLQGYFQQDRPFSGYDRSVAAAVSVAAFVDIAAAAVVAAVEVEAAGIVGFGQAVVVVAVEIEELQLSAVAFAA